MGRIRTVKPELFLHEALYDAEVETGLPLRVAFIGLFTQCDREGRFRWEPRRLKSQVLPYDPISDFSRVLDALATRGFVEKYAVENDVFGCIPTWLKHQSINHRERASELPTIDATDCEVLTSTRAPRVGHAKPTPLFPARARPSGTRNKEQGTRNKKEKVASESDGKKPAKTGGKKPTALDVEIPDELDTPEFRSAWSDLVADRKERKKPITTRAAKQLLTKCQKWGPAAAAESIANTIANGWTGLFEPDNKGGTRRDGNGNPTTGRIHTPGYQVPDRSFKPTTGTPPGGNVPARPGPTPAEDSVDP